MATNPDSCTTTKKSLYLQDSDEVAKVFNRFDANGDGKISGSELADVMRALGSDIPDEEIAKTMLAIDTDSDGFISQSEFAAFCGDGANDPNNDGGIKELREAFELYDQDNNGLISASELHQILNRLGESCSVADCVRMISSVDSNGDGNVSFDEFKKMMTDGNSKPDGASNGSAK